MEIQKNKVYKHFKGNYYLVIDIVTNCDNDKPYVLYKALYGDTHLFVRDYQDFISPVDKIKHPNTTQKYRFELQEDYKILKDK